MKSEKAIKKEKVILELEKANVNGFDYALLDKNIIIDILADCIETYEANDKKEYYRNVCSERQYKMAFAIEPKYFLNKGVYLNFTVTKTDALQFLFAFILGMLTNPMLGFFKAAFSFITKNIYYLNHEDRCLYLYIVEYAEKYQIKEFSLAELREYYFMSKCDNKCPYFPIFECDKHNRESNELCGFYNNYFPLEKIINKLVKLNAIEYNSEKGLINFDVYKP